MYQFFYFRRVLTAASHLILQGRWPFCTNSKHCNDDKILHFKMTSKHQEDCTLLIIYKQLNSTLNHSAVIWRLLASCSHTYTYVTSSI